LAQERFVGFFAEHALDEHGSAVSYIAGDGVAVEFGASDMAQGGVHGVD